MLKRVCASLFVAIYLALRSRSNFGGKVKSQRSRSDFWRVVVDIRGSACRVQQRAITLKFAAKGHCHQSDGCLCVCNQGAFANNRVNRHLICWVELESVWN